MDTLKPCVHDRIDTLCILQTEVYFDSGSAAPQAEPQADAGFSSGLGSAAPQAEPQDDMALVPANAATFSRLLMIVTSLIYLLDFVTSLVYTQCKLQQSKKEVRTILLYSEFFLS